MSFCLIIFIVKDKKLKNILKNKYLVYLGNISFGLYLIHALLIGIVNKIISNLFENKYLVFMLVTLLVLLISIIIIFLGRKFLRKKAKYLGF
ncbi:MAG: acyltransferase family protein [Clostridium sp.]